MSAQPFTERSTEPTGATGTKARERSRGWRGNVACGRERPVAARGCEHSTDEAAVRLLEFAEAGKERVETGRLRITRRHAEHHRCGQQIGDLGARPTGNERPDRLLLAGRMRRRGQLAQERNLPAKGQERCSDERNRT